MTDGQDVRALLKSIGGLKRRVAEMDRQVEQMRAMNAGAYAGVCPCAGVDRGRAGCGRARGAGTALSVRADVDADRAAHGL